MLRRLALPAAFAAALPVAAAADVPRVTADTPVTHSFAAMVMGDLGTPALILDRGGDPHHAQLRPSQARAAARAELLIWSGAGLVPWMERVVDSITGGEALDLSSVADLHRAPYQHTILFDARDDGGDGGPGVQDGQAPETQDAHGDHDHEMETHHHDDEHDHASHEAHDHGTFDPHLWMTPENAAPILNAIAARLSTLDPGNAGTYFGNAAQAIAAVDSLSAELTQTLAPAGDAGLVMYHAAYGYFGEAFDLNLLGTIALGDAADPGAARIAALRAALTGANATCLFPEVNHGVGYVSIVVEGTDLRIGDPLDPAGVLVDPGAGLYAQTLRAMAQSITDCVTNGS